MAKAISLAKELADQGKKVTFKIYKLDRLSRKMFTLANLINDFCNSDIKLVSIVENIETDSLTGRLLCIVLGYVAEIEVENNRIQTKDGLRKAKEKDVSASAILAGITLAGFSTVALLKRKRKS